MKLVTLFRVEKSTTHGVFSSPAKMESKSTILSSEHFVLKSVFKMQELPARSES